MKKYKNKLKKITEILVKTKEYCCGMRNTMEERNTKKVSLCAAELEHEEFLIELFRQCNLELTFPNSHSEEEKTTFILEAYGARQKQIIQNYPKAKLYIILLDSMPIGRLYLSQEEDSCRIIDIVLLDEYRALGVGSKIMKMIIDNAMRNKKTITLKVEWINQEAYKFYKRLGFKAVENNSNFYEMRYMP